MATLVQFSQNIRKRGSQIENAATRFTKTTAARCLRNLVNTTPVDTGAARSNWRVGIGSPARSAIFPYSPGKKLGVSERSNANAAISAGLARIRSVSGVSGRGGGLKTAIYITNALGYVGHLPNGKGLNDGASKQAPAFFIEAAISEAVNGIGNLRVFIAGSGGEEEDE